MPNTTIGWIGYVFGLALYFFASFVSISIGCWLDKLDDREITRWRKNLDERDGSV